MTFSSPLLTTLKCGDEIWLLKKLPIYYKTAILSHQTQLSELIFSKRSGPFTFSYFFVWSGLFQITVIAKTFLLKNLFTVVRLLKSQTHTRTTATQYQDDDAGMSFLREAIEPEMISSLTFQLFTSLSLEIRNR